MTVRGIQLTVQQHVLDDYMAVTCGAYWKVVMRHQIIMCESCVANKETGEAFSQRQEGWKG